jgi:hypothetical protein
MLSAKMNEEEKAKRIPRIYFSDIFKRLNGIA